MKMKKTLIIFLLATIVSLTIATSVLFANSETTFTAHLVNFRILVNNEERNFTYPIVVINDRTYVPLREVGEALNMDVKWCAEEREILITSNQNNNGAFERPSASEGILSTGIRYIFLDTEFNLENLNKRYTIKIETKIIAQTPKEAAEKGHFYLNPAFRKIDPSVETRIVISVHYCSETSNWILQLSTPKSEPPIVGIPPVVVINRIDGKVKVFI